MPGSMTLTSPRHRRSLTHSATDPVMANGIRPTPYRRHNEAAKAYLYGQFGVVEVMPFDPFLVLDCAPSPPARPFPLLIGGFIAIWKPYHNMNWHPLPGSIRAMPDPEEDGVEGFSVDASLTEGFKPNTIPDSEDLFKFAISTNPECIGVA
ncbi:hypothetical protein B0H67DRAFT_548804 [Lasiosphaeris hirsuta]|uniref:Uncharacterized protein n=1 Tax=Lasiosphaeris hirsuta TaxID=260670 RepID=A0AA40BB40_9PEZI|nr:hypothetical protein B0H67DRAFT_548804 [Lasiosphaeris hirsuta]